MKDGLVEKLTICTILAGAWLLSVTVLAGDDSPDASQQRGLKTRVEALEAEAKKAHDLLVKQSHELSELKVQLYKAVQKSSDELKEQIKVTRKEVYGDMGSIVSTTNLEIAGVGRDAGLHFERARKDGYAAGLPNGGLGNGQAGTIRWMPLGLIDKCEKIGKE